MQLRTSHDPGGLGPAGSGATLPTHAPSAPTSPPQWPLLPPLVLFALAAVVIGWPWLSGRVTIPWDAKAHFLPQVQFLAQSLARGEWPFWTPFVFSGHPQIADPQSMIFSPPFVILALLNPAPGSWAMDATLMSVVFLGGAALMLWCRDQGWNATGALIAALVFSYGASMAWRIQHINQVLSLAYLPLAMLCLDRAMTRRSILYGAAAGLAAALIVKDRDQVALLCVYLLVGVVSWRLLSADRPLAQVRRCVLPLAAAAVVGLALVILPVALTALFATLSNRASIDYIGAGRGSLHPALLLTAFVPEVFGASGRMADYWGPPSHAWNAGVYLAQNMGQVYLGAIPLLLLIVAGLRGVLWEREARFFTVALAAMLLYAFGWYTPVFRVLYEVLPGVHLYRRPADATFLVGALAAILAGYSAHRMIADQAAWERRHIAIAASSIAAAFALAIALALWLGQLQRVLLPLIAAALSFAGAALTLAAARRHLAPNPLLALSAIVAFTVVDLAYNNGPNSATALPPATYDVLDPATRNATIAILEDKVVRSETRRDRVELAGLGFHWPNASLTHGLENTLGYNPVRLALYSKATGAIDHVGLPEQREFTAPLFPSYRSTLADLLGLRFIATGVPVEQMDRSLKPGDLALVARTDDGYIYENPRAFDRVLLATEARSADFAQMLSDGKWPDADLHKTVLLEAATPELPPRRPGKARIVSYHNTEVVVEADSPDGGWLVLNDIWHPWWFAELDGQPAEILRANVLFRAVALPAGRHSVRFVFRPLAGAWGQITGRSMAPIAGRMRYSGTAATGSVHGTFRRRVAMADLERAWMLPGVLHILSF